MGEHDPLNQIAGFVEYCPLMHREQNNSIYYFTIVIITITMSWFAYEKTRKKMGKNKDLSTYNRPIRPTWVGFAFPFVLAILTHLKNYVRPIYDFQRISGVSVLKLNTLLSIVLHNLKSCKNKHINNEKTILEGLRLSTTFIIIESASYWERRHCFSCRWFL